MLKTKIFTLITICLITAGISTQVLQAKVGPPHPGPRCTELLVPFNENGVKNPNAALYVTEFSESDCQQHAPYPNQHETISDADADNIYILPAAATTDNEITGLAVHKHFYHNSSEEDANYIYKAIMAGFEITLEADAIQNTYSTYQHLICPSFAGQTGDPQGDPNDPNNIAAQFASCKDGAYDPALLGGTKITRETTAGGQKITWWFGVDDASKRPVRAGKNPSVDIGDNPQIWDCDTSDINADCRTFMSDVTMIARDQSATMKVWTATTTSRALIRDLGLPQSKKFEYQDGNAWVAFEPSNYNPVPEILKNPAQNINADYYWVDIGTNTTVWKPIATPPASYCTGLDITAPGAPTLTPSSSPGTDYEMTPTTPTTFEVKPSFLTTPVPLEYRWSANFLLAQNPPPAAVGNFRNFENAGLFGTNPYNDKDTSTWYSGGVGGTFVTVRGVEPGTSNYVGNGCMSTIFIPSGPPSKKCEKLTPYVQEYDAVTQTASPVALQNTIADRTYYVEIDQLGTIYDDAAETPIPNYKLVLGSSTRQLNPALDLKKIDGSPSCPFSAAYTDPNLKNVIQIDNIPTNQGCTYVWNSQAGDTITYTAIPNDNVPACTVSKTISAPPDSTKECLDLQIYRDNAILVPDVVPFEEPINNLYAVIDTDPQEYAEDLNVSWTSEGGGKIVTFAAQQGSNYDLITPHMTDTVNLYDIVDGTKVTAKAIDPNDPTADLDICEDSFVVGAPPQNICFSLNLTPANASVQAGGSVDISVNPQNENAPHPNYVQWSETGPGYFEAGPNSTFQSKYLPHGNLIPNLPGKFPKPFSKVCPLVPHGSDVSFQAPAHCDYTYVAGPAGGGSFELAAVPNLGDVKDCTYKYTVPPLTKDLYCESLTVDPYGVINLGTNTPYTAKAVFRDAGNNNQLIDFPEIVIGWNGINGTFQSPTTTGPSTNTFNNTFTSTSLINGSVNVAVTSVPGEIVDLSNCVQSFSKTVSIPNNPWCIGLTLTPNEIMGGEFNPYTAVATFSDQKKYNVVTEWSGSRGIYTSSGSPIAETTSLSDQIANTFQSTDNNQGEVRVRLTDVIEQNVDPNTGVCQATITLEPEECRKIRIEETQPDIYCIVEIDADGELQFSWKVIEGEIDFNEYTILPYEECVKIDDITDYPATLRVEAEGYESVCYDEIDFTAPPQTPPGPPELEKGIRVNSSTGNFSKGVVTLPNNPQSHDVYYQLKFTPHNNQITTATISDDISGGFINADVLPLDNNGNEYNSGGDIEYVNGSMDVEEDGNNIPKCSDIPDGEPIEHCYIGDIGSGTVELVKVTGVVTIEYKAILTTNLDDEICADGLICEEQYSNKAEADDVEVEINGQVTKFPKLVSNEILVQLFCQYILTRAAGDIFLETDLLAGVDINQCSEYVSTPGIIVTPGTRLEQTLFKSGAGEATIFAVQHEACTAGQSSEFLTGENKDLLKFYGADVAKTLSSQICEVKLRTGGAWQQEVITNSIEENKTRISRWEADNFGQDVTITDDMATTNPTLAQYDVLHIKDADLTMNASSLADGDGAKTIIVENGDLYIEGDITYEPCNTGDCSSPRSVASLAFIVLDGTIYVNPSVKTMAGVYYVQEGDNEKSGKLISAPKSLNPTDTYSDVSLAIYGSVYGDIEPLLTYRRYAGDPALEQGGIVIRFDERVVLNTPPGLRDVLNLSQTEVAR